MTGGWLAWRSNGNNSAQKRGRQSRASGRLGPCMRAGLASCVQPSARRGVPTGRIAQPPADTRKKLGRVEYITRPHAGGCRFVINRRRCLLGLLYYTADGLEYNYAGPGDQLILLFACTSERVSECVDLYGA